MIKKYILTKTILFQKTTLCSRTEWANPNTMKNTFYNEKECHREDLRLR